MHPGVLHCRVKVAHTSNIFSAAFAQGHWPSGPYNQQYDMRRSLFYQNNPGLAPQNYHYQQMNGNQLVNYQSPCNCIKLKFCSPVKEMASKMYGGYIDDYINSQIQVIACNNIEGEMAVCCPNSEDSREKRGNGKHGHGGSKKWVWDTEEITSSEEVHFSNHPAPPQYPMNRYVTYPIQGFYPFSKANLKNLNKSPFLAGHEDPTSMKNCPPAFSSEFNLPENQSFYKEPEASVTTPVPRVEIATQPESEAFPLLTPEMRKKMDLINDESCGRSVGSRIIGGEDSGIGRFSWMARLAYRNKSLFLVLKIIPKSNEFNCSVRTSFLSMCRFAVF